MKAMKCEEPKNTNEADNYIADDCDEANGLRSQSKKNMPFNNGEKRRFFGFLLENVARTCDELYEICLNEPSLCLETSSLLQNIAYDFVTLDEWLKLKLLCKELPLPERRNSAPSMCVDLVEGATAEFIPEENVEESSITNKVNTQRKPSSVINISAPDFIPAENQTEERLSVSDQSVQTDWVFQTCLTPSYECEDFIDLAQNNNFNVRNNPNRFKYIAPSEDDYGSTLRENRFVCSYIDTPEGCNRICNSTFYTPQNITHYPSDMYSFTPNMFQQNLSFTPQYVPHFHLPYSGFPQEINPNMMRLSHMNLIDRPPHYFYRSQERFYSRPIRGRRNLHNVENKLSNHRVYKKQRHVDKNNASKMPHDSEHIPGEESSFLSSEENDLKPNSNEKRHFERTEVCNHEVVILTTEEQTCNTIGSTTFMNDLTVKRESIQEQNHAKQNILGLAEDECLEHFPELSSEFQKKGKPKCNIVGSLKKTLELKKFVNERIDPTPVGSENGLEKAISFSEAIKIPSQLPLSEKQLFMKESNNLHNSHKKREKSDWRSQAAEKQKLFENSKEKVVDNHNVGINCDENNTTTEQSSSSETQRKYSKRSKWSYFSSLKKPQSAEYTTKSPVLDNVDKCALFSEVIKLSNQLLQKQALQSLGTCSNDGIIKNKNSGSDCISDSSFHKQNELKANILEEHTDNVPHTSLPSTQKDDNSDSDGWEIVRTRSKWRDTSERHQFSKKFNVNAKDNPGSYTIIPPVHERKNFRQFGGSIFRSMDNEHDENGSITETAKSDNPSGTQQENNFHSTDLLSITMKPDNDDLCLENQSNEGWYSSENSYEFSLNQSEAASPEGAKYVDEIDPNEMYSTYMKYLSNVEQGDVDSGSKPNEKILHPESEREMSSNPASLEEMTDFVNKDPIRALDFKNKLDDRIRHQEDVKKKNEAKQQQAQKKRMQFLHDKKAKFRGLVQKVKEVKAAQDELALQRKKRLDLKLKKAEEKRKMYLNIIKRKAHDEEEKLKEIAFINELEAQNRRHDSLALRQEHEERLQCLVEERQRKLEEKAAKEAAVEERKKALEAERKEKLELLRERRRRKEEFIDRKQQEKEQERLVIAREKAREREERLQAIHIAQIANAEELQKRIQQKQEESHKRHIECIKLIRQKAIEIGIHRNNLESSPNQITYKRETSLKTHNVNDKYKLQSKKHLKKIKSRMVMRGCNFIEETHRNPKEFSHKELVKIMKKLMICELDKTYIWQDEDIDSVDRYLDDILFYLQEDPNLCDELKDIKAFIFFESIINTFNNSSHDKLSGPTLRCIIKIITICDLSCLESAEICLYIVLSNILATLLDSLRFSLQALELPSKSWDLIVELLLRFHSLVLEGLNQLPDNVVTTIPDFSTRMKDLMSYILCSGLVNRLVDILRPSIVDEKTLHDPLIVPTILFLKRLLFSWFISEELINILKSTDLFGTVPLLYEGLMKHISNNDGLPDYCLPTLKLFFKLAEVNLNVFQEVLGADNIALQWRGIASGLMTHCVPNDDFEILNIVIKLVGYFAIHNKKNQTLLQSGKQPTVLQQLVKLPFQYFCSPGYMELLFPTLISCSFNNATNRAIVENEVGYNGLEKFMKSEVGQNNPIIKLLLEFEEKSP